MSSLLSSLVTSFQLWLSPRPRRSTIPTHKPIITAGGACTTWFVEEDGKHYIYAEHNVSMRGCQGGENALSTPPLHIHLNQDEFFQVITGKLAATMNGEPMILTSYDKEYRAVKGQPHRFWSVEKEGNLLVRMRVEPEDRKGFDEAFYRNCWGYLNDCDRYGYDPSPFQMALFLYDWDMILATPFPIPIAKALHHVAAYWIGQRLLGYQPSYPEYWTEKKTYESFSGHFD